MNGGRRRKSICGDVGGETRQLPVYKLSVGKSGTKLQASQEGSCTPYITEAPPPTPEEPRPNFCGFSNATMDGLNRSLDGKGVSIAAMAKTLSRTYTSMLGRNVIDGSGLSGTFDIHLTWAMDSVDARAGAIDSTPDLAGPSILTALREQPGLKLESTKGPVEVLVIDHIERPSDN